MSGVSYHQDILFSILPMVTGFRKLRQGEIAPKICLQKVQALYGGMECGRIRWEAWVDWHLNDGFQIIHSERCYLDKRSPDGAYIKLGYHVDDNLGVGVWAGNFISSTKRGSQRSLM